MLLCGVASPKDCILSSSFVHHNIQPLIFHTQEFNGISDKDCNTENLLILNYRFFEDIKENTSELKVCIQKYSVYKYVYFVQTIHANQQVANQKYEIIDEQTKTHWCNHSEERKRHDRFLKLPDNHI